jgi:hypothetical protein
VAALERLQQPRRQSARQLPTTPPFPHTHTDTRNTRPAPAPPPPSVRQRHPAARTRLIRVPHPRPATEEKRLRRKRYSLGLDGKAAAVPHHADGGAEGPRPRHRAYACVGAWVVEGGRGCQEVAPVGRARQSMLDTQVGSGRRNSARALELTRSLGLAGCPPTAHQPPLILEDIPPDHRYRRHIPVDSSVPRLACPVSPAK